MSYCHIIGPPEAVPFHPVWETLAERDARWSREQARAREHDLDCIRARALLEDLASGKATVLVTVVGAYQHPKWGAGTLARLSALLEVKP